MGITALLTSPMELVFISEKFESILEDDKWLGRISLEAVLFFFFYTQCCHQADIEANRVDVV